MPERPPPTQSEEASEITETNAAENPNSIGDLPFSLGVLPTAPENVYRSVRGEAAIHDLEQHGEVRNAQSAGVKKQSRWGNRVFWSRGVEGYNHLVSEGGYVIEAPYVIAAERAVKKEDVTAIYASNAEGVPEDVKDRFLSTGSNEDRQRALRELHSEIGSDESEENR